MFRTATYISRSVRDDRSASRYWFNSLTYPRNFPIKPGFERVWFGLGLKLLQNLMHFHGVGNEARPGVDLVKNPPTVMWLLNLICCSIVLLIVIHCTLFLIRTLCDCVVTYTTNFITFSCISSNFSLDKGSSFSDFLSLFLLSPSWKKIIQDNISWFKVPIYSLVHHWQHTLILVSAICSFSCASFNFVFKNDNSCRWIFINSKFSSKWGKVKAKSAYEPSGPSCPSLSRFL